MKLSDEKFDFKIEDVLEMDGALEKIIAIPAQGRQNISVHTRMTDGSVLKTGWKMLTDKKDTHFLCKFTGKIDSENKMLSRNKLVITISGTLNEINNTVKKAN